MNTFVVALLSIGLSVTAQFLLKFGLSSPLVRESMSGSMTLRNFYVVLTNGFVFTGFMVYGVGAIVWLSVLSKWDVSKAYPMVGLGFVLTMVVGLMQGEHVSYLRMSGVLFICVGVYIVGKS